MAVNDPSTNFEWALPDVGGDTDVWDDDATEGLNTLFNEIDTDVKAVADELDVVEADASDLDTRVLSLESAQILPVYAQAAMVSKPAIPTSTATAIPLAEVLDSVGMFDAGEPTRLTIPDGSDGPLSQDGRFNLGGLYKFKAFAHVPTWTGSDNGRAWTLTVRKNGDTDIASRRWPSLGAGQTNTEDELTLVVECMDEAAPGDYYELVLLTDSGLDAGVIRSATFEAYRLPSPRFTIPHVLYSAGLDVHGEDSADYDRYATANELDWEDDIGKFGGGAIRSDASASGWTIRTLDEAQSGGKIAWYGQVAFDSGSETNGFIRIMSGAALQFSLYYRKDEADLRLLDDGGSVLATWDATDIGGSSVTPGPIHHFEIEWGQSTAGTGALKVYIDGAAVIEISNLETPNATWDTLVLRGPTTGFLAGGDWYKRDDIVIQSPLGQRLGDGHRIYTVLPDADGDTNEWNPQPATDHFALVDDTDPDQDSSAVSTSTDGAREEFTFTLPSITGTIREVVVKSLARSGDVNPGELKLGLRVDGTETLSESITVPVDSQKYKEQQFAVAGPPGGGVWTTANLADAVLLLEKADSDALNVTQMWLEIITTA